MSDTELTTDTQPAVSSTDTAPASVPAAPAYDPSYVEQLQNYYQQTHPIFEKIAPIYSDLEPMLEDEDRRKFVKDSLSFYQKAKADQAPKLPTELETLKSEILSQIQPVIELTSELRKEQQSRRASEEKQAQDANQAYFQKIRTQAVFQENNGLRLQQLINYAVANGLSLEGAHRQFYAETSPVAESAPIEEASPTIAREQKAKTNAYEQSGGDVHSYLLNTLKKAQRSSRAS